MSIRCGACRGRHDTVSQVLDCSARMAGQSTCKHDLAPGTCVTCARWNKRKGTKTIRSNIAHPPAWIQELDPHAEGTCALCGEIIVHDDEITVRRGFHNWSHTDCFTDPGTASEQPAYKSQRETEAPYNDAYSRITALENAADALLPQAIAEECETDILCLKQVALDMSLDLSIDLIRETIYGYSLEQLGAFEPKDELDTMYLDADADMILAAEMRQAWASLD